MLWVRFYNIILTCAIRMRLAGTKKAKTSISGSPLVNIWLIIALYVSDQKEAHLLLTGEDWVRSNVCARRSRGRVLVAPAAVAGGCTVALVQQEARIALAKLFLQGPHHAVNASQRAHAIAGAVCQHATLQRLLLPATQCLFAVCRRELLVNLGTAGTCYRVIRMPCAEVGQCVLACTHQQLAMPLQCYANCMTKVIAVPESKCIMAMHDGLQLH